MAVVVDARGELQKKSRKKQNSVVIRNRTECSIFSFQHRQAMTQDHLSKQGKPELVTRTLRECITIYAFIEQHTTAWQVAHRRRSSFHTDDRTNVTCHNGRDGQSICISNNGSTITTWRRSRGLINKTKWWKSKTKQSTNTYIYTWQTSSWVEKKHTPSTWYSFK